MKTRPLKLKGDAVKNNNKDIVHRDEIYINVLWQEELKILEENYFETDLLHLYSMIYMNVALNVIGTY